MFKKVFWATLCLLVLVPALLIPVPKQSAPFLADLVGIDQAWACNVPNPNLLANPPSVPFVDGCDLPSSTLNRLFGNINNFTNVETFGVVGDATTTAGTGTDNCTTLQTAFNSGKPLLFGGHIYRSSCTLNLPDYGVLAGLVYAPNTFGVKGSVIQCDVGVSSYCITAGQNDNKPISISNLVISHATGTPTGNCLNINGSQFAYVTRVECYNHVAGFAATGDGTSNGIYNFFDEILTCRVSDSDIIINSVPGVYVNNSVIGCNGSAGSGDVPSANYVKVIGNWDNVKGTIHFTNTHFNHGQLQAACAFAFAGFTGTTNILFDFEVIGGHVEVAEQGICTDGTVKGLSTFQILGVWMDGGWGGTNALFALNAATLPSQWTLAADHFAGWSSATLAPTGGFDDVKVTGSSFNTTPITLTAGTSNSVNFEGNEYQGLTVSGNWQGPGSRITGLARAGGGSYTYTFTGNLQLDVTNESLNLCAVALHFAGGSGLTQTLNACTWEIHGSYVDVTVYITVTALGTSSGNATLTGLPQPANTLALTLSPCYNINTAGLATSTNNGFYANPVASMANLFTQAATSDQPLTIANFTATSQFSCSMHYPLAT